MATATGIAKLLRMILEFYPNTKIDVDESTVKRWGLILSDVPDNETHRALVDYIREGNRFPPNAADIARMCQGTIKQLRGDIEHAELDNAEIKAIERLRELNKQWREQYPDDVIHHNLKLDFPEAYKAVLGDV